MGFKIETVSEEGYEDYEVWTCKDCGYTMVLSPVGGDVSECPGCLERHARVS